MMVRYKDGAGFNCMRGKAYEEQDGHASSLQQSTGDCTHSVDFLNFN